jgi:hypothetical protein
MSNRIQAYDRSLALYIRVETLTQQLEELQRLRDRVQSAEAKAVCAWRYERRRRRTDRSFLLRHGRPLH